MFTIALKERSMPFMQVGEAVELIQMEYAEMPQMTLTFWQAQRLWNLSPELAERALTLLTRSNFLVRTADGRYIRRTHASRESSMTRELQ
jgi:hypothetical protein